MIKVKTVSDLSNPVNGLIQRLLDCCPVQSQVLQVQADRGG